MPNERIALCARARSTHTVDDVAAHASVGEEVCFPDDIAAVLARMREALPFLLASVDRWLRVSGLALKHSRCVFIPIWDGSVDGGCRNAFCDEAGLPEAWVATATIYLGVTVGTDTRAALGRGRREDRWESQGGCS